MEIDSGFTQQAKDIWGVRRRVMLLEKSMRSNGETSKRANTKCKEHTTYLKRSPQVIIATVSCSHAKLKP